MLRAFFRACLLAALLGAAACHRQPTHFVPDASQDYSLGMFHRVDQGQTLDSIAAYYRRNPALLARFNELKPPYRLTLNEHLYIPPTNDYSILKNPRVGIESIRAGRARLDKGTVGSEPLLRRAEKQKYIVPKSDVEKKKTTQTFKRKVAPASQSKASSASQSKASSTSSASAPRKTSSVAEKTRQAAASISPKRSKPRPKPTSAYALPLPQGSFRYVRQFNDGDWRNAHSGVDLAAPGGTMVRAIASGTVLQVGKMGSYGHLVIVDHGDGYSSLYGQVDSKPLVREGQKVSQGQTIAKIDSPERGVGPHLHLEVRYNESGEGLDPALFVPGLGTLEPR